MNESKNGIITEMIAEKDALDVEFAKLTKELARPKQRDKYFEDKQLLQREMKQVNKQLDELDGSKTMLLKQIEQLMAFQNNTIALKEKMEQYSAMSAGNQQKINQLEAM